jgi:NADPH-dependent glutamate synthase beta subunit-like oxidoreductase
LEDYQAIFIATGAHQSRGLNIPGEKGKGVYQGLDFLKKINLKARVKLGEKIAVIGGGNTAIDVARSVGRLGYKATVVYRRSREEMPAIFEEVEEAIREGIEIHFLISPVKVMGRLEKAIGMECIRMKLGISFGFFLPLLDPCGEIFCPVLVLWGYGPDYSAGPVFIHVALKAFFPSIPSF